jgi:large subunit ribosomal protein L29
MSVLTEELRNMDTEELETRLNETRQELFNLRFQLVTGQLDNSSRIGQVRRQVARIETLLREREIEEAEELEAGEQVPAHREPKSRPITGVVLTVPTPPVEESESDAVEDGADVEDVVDSGADVVDSGADVADDVADPQDDEDDAVVDEDATAPIGDEPEAQEEEEA